MANLKISQLTEDTAPTHDDLIVTVNDPAGTAASKKSKLSSLFAAMQTWVFGADAGSTDTYVVTLSPVPTGYVTGQHYRFKANTANTGACTVNFNSLGAKTIKKAAGGITTDLADNDIRAGQWVDLVYDGTNMQMQSQLGNVPSGTTPGAHAASHQNGGSDEIDVTGLSGVLADPQVPITESVQDIVGAMVVAGTNVTITYNDAAGTLTIDATGGGSIAPLVVESANEIAQRNGANAQTLRIYQNYASAGATYNRLAFKFSGSDPIIETESNGGSGGDLTLKKGTASLVWNGTTFVPSTAGSINLGTSSFYWNEMHAANVYVDGAEVRFTATSLALAAGATGRLHVRTQSNNGGGTGIGVGDFNSSGFLIKKGSSGNPEIRTGDDSAFSSLVALKFCYNSALTVCDFAGSGSPEGAVTAGVGSTYRRTDGGAGTSFYVKESGSGNTGWVAK